jgi:hypothetical protein
LPQESPKRRPGQSKKPERTAMEKEKQRASFEEIPLLGERLTPGIVRVGNTVRRPPNRIFSIFSPFPRFGIERYKFHSDALIKPGYHFPFFIVLSLVKY